MQLVSQVAQPYLALRWRSRSTNSLTYLLDRLNNMAESVTFRTFRLAGSHTYCHTRGVLLAKPGEMPSTRVWGLVTSRSLSIEFLLLERLAPH